MVHGGASQIHGGLWHARQYVLMIENMNPGAEGSAAEDCIATEFSGKEHPILQG